MFFIIISFAKVDIFIISYKDSFLKVDTFMYSSSKNTHKYHTFHLI